MKTVKKSKTRNKLLKLFFRFLKDNDAYFLFKRHYKGNENGYEENIHNFVKNRYIRPLYYIMEIINIYGPLYNFWYNIDRKWMIYMYEHNLYGTPQTCSKCDLIEFIEDIFDERECIEDKTIIENIEAILIKENILCPHSLKEK